MRRMIGATSWLILATALAPAFARQADKAMTKLEGTWTATKAERDGKAAADVVGHRLTFTGTRFVIKDMDGKSLYEGTFKLDAKAKPAAIDFAHAKGELKGKTWKGIYAIDGDTLKVCDNAPDLEKKRPAAFEAKKDSGYVFITFTRAKP